MPHGHKQRAKGAASLLVLAVLVLPAQSQSPAYPHENEPIGTIEQVYDGTLLPDLAVSTFRNIHRLFPSRTIAAGDTPARLPVAEEPLENIAVEIDGRTYDLYDFLAGNNVAGMIVIRDGAVAYETYQRGNTPQTRWMSMSIAKSITSTLVGAAIQDGYIESLDSQVADYVTELQGTAYDGVTVRDVLMMSSGVQWNEAYTDPESDRRDLLRAQIAQEPGAALAIMAALPRAADPGTVHNYSTGETQVLAEIVHRAVGKPLADYLSERIWAPYGMEADATWWLDSPDGIEIGGSGISATLRDYGRFGQFFLDGGVIDGEHVLPPGWTEEAVTPQTLENGEPLDYGYMWWTGWTAPSIADRAFMAIGIQGQYIYVNPEKNIVIVVLAAQSKPVSQEHISYLDFFDAIAASL
jgi:CubicO group peptidase (beta-lactamase class C family)